MAGLHPAYKWYHREILEDPSRIFWTYEGHRSYRHTAPSFIFWSVPHEFYSTPEAAFPDILLEDCYHCLAYLRAGHTGFRICIDAPFSKPRLQEGGAGNASQRVAKLGRAFTRIAQDFPEYCEVRTITYRFPWTKIVRGELP